MRFLSLHHQTETNMENVIKAAGLKVKSVSGTFTSTLSKRKSESALGLFNDKGEILAIDGRPYFPIGGRLAFKEIVKAGLDHPNYSFIAFKNN